MKGKKPLFALGRAALPDGLSSRRAPSMRRLMPMRSGSYGESPFEPSISSSSSRLGCVEVVCGSMFSGKTEELLRRAKRARLARQRVVLFKPRIDNRYDDVKVVSHEGIKAEATAVSTAAMLLSLLDESDLPEVVGVDEAQFFDEHIVDVAEKLADAGVRVICAGLDQDYLGKPFGPMPALMSIAEYVTKLHAVCSRCGASACRSQRLVGKKGQLFVGGVADYEPRCRRCFVPGVVDFVDDPFSRSRG